MTKSRSVAPMSRVMLRSEFEKRLADYSVQMLKAFKTYEQHWDKRLAALEERLAALEVPAVPDALLERERQRYERERSYVETTAP